MDRPQRFQVLTEKKSWFLTTMNKKSGFPMQNSGFPMNESEKIRESGGKPAAFPIIGFTS